MGHEFANISYLDLRAHVVIMVLTDIPKVPKIAGKIKFSDSKCLLVGKNSFVAKKRMHCFA